MRWLALLWGCGATVPTPQPEGTPRSPEAACARLEAIGVRCGGCEGGSLGDEVSLACKGTLDARPVTLDAVTTGMPLPETPGSVGAMVEDLWVEVRVLGPTGPDEDVARGLLRRYAAPLESR